MNEKQLLALARKNAAKAARALDSEKRARKTYDPTVDVAKGNNDDQEAEKLFKEMKRREF